jgi:para-aminobenzoate synthetase / 4-amino-4-deoxychorismate lyase
MRAMLSQMPPEPPDPSHGLFETVLVANRAPVELAAHLARLATSVEQLFGQPLPRCVATEAKAVAAGSALGRLRIQVTPAEDGGLRHAAVVEPIEPAIVFPPHQQGAELRTVLAEHGQGAHKWSDRRWLERTEERLGEEVPLLVDGAGIVLEAGRANVFAVLDGTLSTPPADGRILPGTARATVLRLAPEQGIEVEERPLAIGDLHRSGEVFLTSSLRGIRPARSLDGEPLPGHGTTDRLAAELRRRWLES